MSGTLTPETRNVFHGNLFILSGSLRFATFLPLEKDIKAIGLLMNNYEISIAEIWKIVKKKH